MLSDCRISRRPGRVFKLAFEELNDTIKPEGMVPVTSLPMLGFIQTLPVTEIPFSLQNETLASIQLWYLKMAIITLVLKNAPKLQPNLPPETQFHCEVRKEVHMFQGN